MIYLNEDRVDMTKEYEKADRAKARAEKLYYNEGSNM
jgi:hypothetical protein